ncbi:MAG: hypothetical protein ACFFGZ_03270 [Candidatus Thorarchaeota archaeon]
MNIRNFLSNLREVSHHLSRGSKDAIKVCPVCLSTKIGPESSWVGGWLTPARFICDECGYKGYLYLETDLESLKTALEAKRKEEQQILEEQSKKAENWDKGIQSSSPESN